MVPRWIIAFGMMLLEGLSARRDARIQFLKLQVELLRARVPGNRVILPGLLNHYERKAA